jgi:hypothetical protein
MRRQADRLAGGKLPGCKERGDWAELYFMMQAAGLGMKVSRPFGVGIYDVGVENPGRVLRVQVKSTIYKRSDKGYCLDKLESKLMKYESGTVDFFAVLLIPLDDWYIIPFEVMERKNFNSRFMSRSKPQDYAFYLEAWHLLKDTGLTIQACCDEDWPELDARTAGSSTPQDHLLRE